MQRLKWRCHVKNAAGTLMAVTEAVCLTMVPSTHGLHGLAVPCHTAISHGGLYQERQCQQVSPRLELDKCYVAVVT